MYMYLPFHISLPLFKTHCSVYLSIQSQASSSHGQSLTSTGGSDSVKSADLLLTSGNRSTGLATIELGGGGISNKFEEEDEESESSSVCTAPCLNNAEITQCTYV